MVRGANFLVTRSCLLEKLLSRCIVVQNSRELGTPFEEGGSEGLRSGAFDEGGRFGEGGFGRLPGGGSVSTKRGDE